MNVKAKRGRPAKADAKVAVSLRLRPDVVKAYRALGSDWRAQMEAAIVAGIGLVIPKPLPKPPKGGSSVKPPAAKRAIVETVSEAKPFTSRLKGEWKAP